MKSEFNNRNRLSSDIFVDANCAKIMTDKLCLPSDSKMAGYIQEITMNPFGFLTMSDIQVNNLTKKLFIELFNYYLHF